MEEVTNRQVIAYANSCRVRISAAQLSRWREIGLLGHYRRRGRGRGKGQTVYYSPGAKRLAVMIWRELQTTRDLYAVGWKLWLRGYPVPGLARRVLVRCVEDLEREEERSRSNAALPKRRQNPLWTHATPEQRHAAEAGYRMIRGLPPEYSQLASLAASVGKPLARDLASQSKAISDNKAMVERVNADTMRAAIQARTYV